jgi:hypothetical protein
MHSANDRHPSVFYQNTTGNLWVVWASNRAGNYDIWCKMSSDGGVNWSLETQLTNDSNRDDHPSIMQAADGSVWVVWTRVTNQYDLYYKNSSDGGVNWSEEKQLTNDTGNDLNPSITQAADGTIWVAWQSDRIWVEDPWEPGSYIPQDDIFYKNSSDGGATWFNDTQLTTDPGDDTSPSITQTSDEMIWVVWASNRYDLGNLFYVTSSDGGANWTDDEQLTYEGDDGVPSITQTSDGRIWVVFYSERGGNYDIFYKVTSNGGVTWSIDIRLTTDPNVDAVPSITQTADGKIRIVWMSNRLAADLDDDGDVDSADFILFGGAYPSDPALDPKADLDGDGDVDSADFILFVGNYGKETGNYDIWYKTSIILLGDLDGDGDVDSADFILFGGAYPSDPALDPKADLDGDGDVDSADFILFVGYYGKSVP